MPDALKVFVSYSRRDMAASDALVADLESHGFQVVIDRRDLPYGEAWQTELSDFIKASDTVVWLVSPASVRSRWVNWELGEVQRLNKRLVPVVAAAVAPEELPEALGRLHLLPAEGVYGAERHLAALVEALETDRAWIKQHSRLGDRAREWAAGGRKKDLLLRGAALSDAEAWRAAQPPKAPSPSGEILTMIAASERQARSRARQLTAILSGVAIATLALAATATVQATIAAAERDQAVRNENRALARDAQQFRAEGAWAKAMALAVYALSPRPGADEAFVTPEAERALREAFYDRREVTVFAQDVRADGFDPLVWSGDGARLLLSDVTTTRATLWSLESGSDPRFLGEAPPGAASDPAGENPWPGEESVAKLRGVGFSFSPDGAHLIGPIVGGYGLGVWDGAASRERCRFEPERFEQAWTAWSPDSAAFAVFGLDPYTTAEDRKAGHGLLEVFDVATCARTLRHQAGTDAIGEIAWSPDSARIALPSGMPAEILDAKTGDVLETGTDRLSDLRRDYFMVGLGLDRGWSADGALFSVLYGYKLHVFDGRSYEPVSVTDLSDSDGRVRWSPAAAVFATGAPQGPLRVRDGAVGGPLAALSGLRDFPKLVAWSPDGARLAATDDARTTLVWDVASAAIIARFTGRGEAGPVVSLAWAPDSARLAMLFAPPDERSGQAGQILIADVEASPAAATLTRRSAPRAEQPGAVTALSWSPDGERLLALHTTRKAQLWERAASEGRPWSMVKRFEEAHWAGWSADGRFLDLQDYDRTTRQVWDLEAGAIAADGGALAEPVNPSERCGLSIKSEPAGAGSDPEEDVVVRPFDGPLVIAVRERETRALIATAPIDGSRYRGVALSPSCAHFATARVERDFGIVDTVISVWGVRSGDLVAQLSGRTRVSDVAFSPDGTEIAVGFGDGDVKIWPLFADLDRLRADAAQIVARLDPLSFQEKCRFGVESEEACALRGFGF